MGGWMEEMMYLAWIYGYTDGCKDSAWMSDGRMDTLIHMCMGEWKGGWVGR
jgi:hypothetical protein